MIKKLELIKDLYPYQPKSLEVAGGHRLSYVDEGQGDPMLMVHGNPTWSFFYRRLIEGFKGSFRTVVPDHIGCGFSDKPQDYKYTLENHIGNLEKLILELDLKNITLVVHDWGGAIGTGLAGRHPERFKRIVIFNTGAFRSMNIPKRIATCRMPVFGKVAVRGFNAFAGAATFMTTLAPLSDEVKQGFLLPYDNWENRIATHEFVLDIPLKEGHRSWGTLVKVEENLSKLKHLPMRIIWGKHDWCFDDTFLQQWKGFFPKALVTEIEAGHYLLEDKPEDILRMIQEFIKQN
jgi:cis-3-alkyl-4-acyloxetan-2-one decarboxylase